MIRAAIGKIFLWLNKQTAQDLELQSKILAAQLTARYISCHFTSAVPLIGGSSVLRHGLENVRVSGQILEFGVFRGESVNFIADHISGYVEGFDSFEGLPEAWRPGFQKGRFALEGKDRLPKVRNNVRLHRGLFEETLSAFITPHSKPVAFIHVDCDLYSSTRTVLEKLKHLIVPGTVIVFDEYFNYPSWQLHEHRAFKEFINSGRRKYRYLAYNSRGEQVAVIIEG